MKKCFADHKSAWKVRATTSLDRALAGADYVLVTVSVGGDEMHGKDIKAAAKHGALATIGDTYGVTGISRALRHVPFIVALARRMERLCPNAWLFNYTNPLTALTQAVSQLTAVKTAGFCHGVVNAITNVGRFLNYSTYRDVSFEVAGVDHCSWLLKIRRKGHDLYPALRRFSSLKYAERMKRCTDKGSRDTLKNLGRAFDICRDTGYFPTIAQNHIVEFFRPLLARKSDLARYGYRHGETQADIRSRRAAQIKQQLQAFLDGSDEDVQGHNDLLARPIAALEGGVPMVDVLNYMNVGQIPEFENGVVVETLNLVDETGIHPITCGPLPATVKNLVAHAAYWQELVIEAAMETSHKKVMAALLTSPHNIHYDNLAALADELLKKNRRFRPKGQ